MSKLKDLPEVERPREKLVKKGVDNLKDEELLAILLGTGTKEKNVLELSKGFLKKYSKKKILGLEYDEIVKNKGINFAKACIILSAIEFTKRLLDIGIETLPIIENKEDIVAQVSDLRDKKQEHFVVLYLNARKEMVFKKEVFIGVLNGSLVHPREIFSEALDSNHISAGIILVHNHPSGDSEPSEEDLSATRRIVEAGKLMGVFVWDHLIITKNKVFSFKENKLI